MSLPIENEFAEVYGKTWRKEKPKCHSGTGNEFNILIPSNCSHLKTPYLNSEIYNKLHDAATNRKKRAQQKQMAYIKATISLMQAVVNLKEIEKKAKREFSKETFSKRNTEEKKYDVYSTQGTNFSCYYSCLSTDYHFLMSPPLRKCIKI